MKLAKNSSGKIIATIIITNNKIYIDNYSKPILQIEDSELIKKINNKENEGIIELYDKYTLLIGEIAALYDEQYYKINKKILSFYKQNLLKTFSKSGRRNSSFGLTFSEERKKKISEKTMGRKSTTYVRTKQIKEKISNTLKQGHKEGRIVVNKEKISQAWVDGKYKNAKMGRGIQGFFHSLKNHRKKGDIYFRSLLELKFLLLVENDDRVFDINMEPFCIKLDNNFHYLPDCLINNKYLIEIKPQAHLK